MLRDEKATSIKIGRVYVPSLQLGTTLAIGKEEIDEDVGEFI